MGGGARLDPLPTGLLVTTQPTSSLVHFHLIDIDLKDNNEENCHVDVNIDYEEYNEAVLELCKKDEYSCCEK